MDNPELENGYVSVICS